MRSCPAASSAESERELTVGGIGRGERGALRRFDYVALGHLHGRQTAGSERIRYSGSLLKYSFSETDQQKSVTIVDLDENGDLSIEEATLPVKRDVRRVRGPFEELLAGRWTNTRRGLRRSDPHRSRPRSLNPVDRLRKKFPHLLSLRREESDGACTGRARGAAGIKTRSTLDLFADFFLDVRGSR